MKTHLYKLVCLTDMHVGDGEANYNIIDNEVQRDTVLNVPIIHASSLKGSLREYFETFWTEKNDERILSVFGGQDQSTGKTVSGTYKFFSAVCLARPLRLTADNASYMLATSQEILDYFANFLKKVGAPSVIKTEAGNEVEAEVEGKIVKVRTNNSEIADRYAVVDNLGDYDLPVRARNCLDGTGNLWYEEFVPHESVFLFVVMTPDGDKCFDEFDKELQSIVQFGANSSIGNGYAAITRIAESK